MWLHEFLILACVHFLAVILPGPDFGLIVRQSIRYGRKMACISAIGIGCGISVHVFYTLIGFSFLIKQTPWLLLTLKILGACYLLYLGILFIRSSPTPQVTIQENKSKDTQEISPWRAFYLGFITNALNPKATLFFLSIFTTLISPSTPLTIQALYGLWMCSINALWFVFVSFIFSNTKVRTAFLNQGKLFERIMGIIFIVIATKLIFSQI